MRIRVTYTEVTTWEADLDLGELAEAAREDGDDSWVPTEDLLRKRAVMLDIVPGDQASTLLTDLSSEVDGEAIRISDISKI